MAETYLAKLITTKCTASTDCKTDFTGLNDMLKTAIRQYLPIHHGHVHVVTQVLESQIVVVLI